MEVGEVAVLRRRPVFGRTTLGRIRSARREQDDLAEQKEDSDFSPEFVFYSDDEKLERSESISSNCVDIISNQERGCGRKFQPVKFSSDFGARQALKKTIVREHRMVREDINKVFCSQWLSDRQVIFGTKCSKLMVVEVNSKSFHQIPTLRSSSESLRRSGVSDGEGVGMQAIAINPSRTLLATNALPSTQPAVYRL